MKFMPNTLARIKSALDDHIGETLMITSHVGRKKVLQRKGILSGTFPAVFVIELDQGQNKIERVSYSYTDVLTKNIKLKLDDDQAGEMLFFDGEVNDDEESE